MINIENVKLDNRFYINDFDLNRITKNRNLIKYEIVTIKLKHIRMFIEGKYLKLNETIVYQYIKNNDEKSIKKYNEYCKKYGKKNPNRTLESCNELLDNFIEYDIKKGAIVVDKYNNLLDGQHRCCILLNEYGDNKEIEVVKFYFKETIIKKIKNFIKFRIKGR